MKIKKGYHVEVLPNNENIVLFNLYNDGECYAKDLKIEDIRKLNYDNSYNEAAIRLSRFFNNTGKMKKDIKLKDEYILELEDKLSNINTICAMKFNEDVKELKCIAEKILNYKAKEVI